MSGLPRILHILYGGLGGHASVVFSLVEGSRGVAKHGMVFVGRGELVPEYAERARTARTPFVFEPTRGGADLSFRWRVLRHMLRARPDTIVVHSASSLIPAVLAKRLRPSVRLVSVEHQSWHLRGRSHDVGTVLGLLWADEIVALNDDHAAHIRQRFPGLSRRAPITVVRNGVDTSRFTPGGQRARTPDAAVRIGMQSRMTPIKDHSTLIRAFARLQKQSPGTFELHLAGDGPTQGELQRLSRELGVADAVTFRGMLDEDALITFLQELDIYVHASFGEAMSTALLQAMACGLPIVASEVPGIADLYEGTATMVLVPPDDVEALSSRIRDLADDEALRGEMAEEALTHVREQYGLDSMWRSYGPSILPAHMSARRTPELADSDAD